MLLVSFSEDKNQNEEETPEPEALPSLEDFQDDHEAEASPDTIDLMVASDEVRIASKFRYHNLVYVYFFSVELLMNYC